MARALTAPQLALLKSDKAAVNVLLTFYLDSGTFRFCDNGRDMFNGVDTFIGASAFTDSMEIRSAQDLAAEPVTMVLDGNRMAEYGIQDPARVLSDILTYLYQQRRVDIAFGFRYVDSYDIQLTIPMYAGKINYARLVDADVSLSDEGGADLDPNSGSVQVSTSLEIVLDSLAKRYTRATNRTRTHQDQLELDPTDMFYSFVADTTANEKTLYWGGNAPVQSTSTGAVGRYNGNIGQGIRTALD